MYKSLISVFVALVLAFSLCPASAFATASDVNEGTLDQAEDSTLEYGEVEAESPDDEKETDSLSVKQEEDDESDADTEADDPDGENSWRFSNGSVVSSQEGANTDASSLGYGISAYSMVTNPNGYKVFNWFDSFSAGYYTGTGAYKGIDVSQHNGSIDWAEVKQSGVDFAIIRCGYGMDYSDQDDSKWLANVEGCLENDIPFGVYIYSYATNTTRASSEADHVLRLLDEAGLEPDDLAYPIFFDMEDSTTIGSDYAAIAKTFCNKIESAGYEPGIYANKDWFNTKLTNSCFNNWTKWVAEWNASSGLTYSGLSDFTSGNGMWQFSDYGSVPGISGAVDLNYTFMEPSNEATVEDKYSSPSKPYSTPVEEGEYYINTALSTSMVLDIASGSADDGANAQIYSSNSTEAQRFTFTFDSKTGFYSIVSVKSGKALGLKKKANGTYSANVAQYTKDSNDNSQKWIISQNSDGSIQIISAINRDYVLDVDGAKTANKTNVQIYTSNSTSAQKWYLLPVDPQVTSTETVESGLYYICASGDKSQVIDITSGSTADKANVQLYESNNTAAQKFFIEYGSDGFYTITNLKSGKVLDVTSGKYLLKTNIQQYSANGTDAQKWAIKKNSDGTYTFVSKLSGQVLDIASGSLSNGANIQTYVSNGTKAQQFILEDAKCEKTVENGTYTISTALSDLFVVDVASGSSANSANVQTYLNNGTAAQKFEFRYDDSTGFYTIINKKSGKVLDVTSAKYANKTNVQQYSSNGTLAQRWIVTTNDDGTVTIASAANPKYVLDVTSGKIGNKINIQIYSSNGTAAQRWNLQDEDYSAASTDPVILGGTYYIRSGLNINKVLDIKSAGTANSVNAQLYQRNNTKAQQFKITYDEYTGLYTITNVNSGKVLDVSGAKVANKTNVQQYSSNGTLAQRWIISENKDGSYKITSALSSDYVLDVNGANTANGTNIQIYSSNSTLAQAWYFDSVG